MQIIHLSPPLGWTLWRWIVERRFRPQATVRRHAGVDERDLADLDPRTLRDIGASPSLQARAQALSDARRDDRDALRLGVAAAGWRHW